MKFLAILKDSLRETLDVKLLYVMLALSLIIVLLVASITYKPVPVEQQVRFTTNLITMAVRAQMHGNPETQNIDFRFDIENFEQTNDRPEPWLGNYRFDYVVTLSNLTPEPPPGGPEEGRQQKNAKDRTEMLRKQVKKDFTAENLERQFKNLFVECKVTEVPSTNPDEVRFRIVTDKGTKIKSRHEWIHEPYLFFGAVRIPVPLFSLGQIIEFVGDDIIGTWGAAFTMLLSTILTASFVPNMLTKGTIDLLLAKPIHRTTLLLYKYVGGLLFMLLNTSVIMIGIWLAIGLQSGLWISAFLLCIAVFTFEFAILYAVSTVTAVLTRSAIVAILVTIMLWGALIIIGWTHWLFIEKGRADKAETTRSHWAYVGFDVVRAVLPRYKDLDWLTSRVIREELIKPRPLPPADPNDPNAVQFRKMRQKVIDDVYEKQKKDLEKSYGAFSWTSALVVSSVWIALLLGLACWRFASKDY